MRNIVVRIRSGDGEWVERGAEGGGGDCNGVLLNLLVNDVIRRTERPDVSNTG